MVRFDYSWSWTELVTNVASLLCRERSNKRNSLAIENIVLEHQSRVVREDISEVARVIPEFQLSFAECSLHRRVERVNRLQASGGMLSGSSRIKNIFPPNDSISL